MSRSDVAPTPSRAQRLPLGDCVLDLTAGELYGADGQRAPLRKQALRVLLMLGERAGCVVGKDDLMQQIWPQVVVGEGSLTQAVVDIRRALGDHEHRLVRNVARRGYLLAAPAGAEGRAMPPAAVPASMVVLPLAVEGGGAAAQAFAAVLHDELIGELSRLDNLVVIARGTAATYRELDVDPRRVARDLNVRYVVSGSLRHDGDRQRLALRLVDGDSGVQRASESFDVVRGGLIAAVDDSVALLARALAINVFRSEAVRSSALSPSQLSADDLAHRAMGFVFRGLTRDNLREMLALAEQAVDADPTAVRGWGALAIAIVQSLNNGWIEGDDARNAARVRAAQASAALDRLAPDHFNAMQARVIEAYSRRDFTTMLQRSKSWVEVHRHPVAYGGHAVALYHNDQPDDAAAWLERALRVSPLDPFRAEWMYRLAWSHTMSDRFDDALAWSLQALAVNPQLPWPPLHAAAQRRLGRTAEAQASWNAFRQCHPRYEVADVLNRLAGDAPRLAAARGRLVSDLSQLGLR